MLPLAAFLAPSAASAATAPVGLGTAASYSVLGGQAVTNTGPSVLGGDLGVSPGTALTGFPPGLVGGATHAADAAAAQAQSDVVTAYNDTAGRAPTASVAGDLVGRTLTAGVYKSTGPLAISGTVTLNGQGNPNSVFIFQVASTLITASASHVSTINGAQACHIYWQVASSATLGTASTFQGTVLALTSISVTTSTTVKGRALARNGQVSLDTNTFTSPACAVTSPSSAVVSPARVTVTPSPAASASVPATASAARRASTTAAVLVRSSAAGTGIGTNGSIPTGLLAKTGSSSVQPALGLASLLLLLGTLVLALSRRRVRAMHRPGSTRSH